MPGVFLGFSVPARNDRPPTAITRIKYTAYARGGVVIQRKNALIEACRRSRVSWRDADEAMLENQGLNVGCARPGWFSARKWSKMIRCRDIVRQGGLPVRGLLLCFVLILGFATSAVADDIAAAQSTIRSQTEAFGRDDADAAYSYAAPGIRDIFPRADIFMSMVRRSYAPVYRHKSFEFGDARSVAGQIQQDVRIIDEDGEAWDALYTLEPQPDGSLKIVGCVLKKAPGQAV